MKNKFPEEKKSEGKMANSTKIAIVGLMILLVVVVAKYVKTGAPVNEGSAGAVAALNAGSQGEAENLPQDPPRSGLDRRCGPRRWSQ